MASLFSKIISGEIPSHKIFEEDRHLAFLDIAPLATGHTLVIPKKEVDYIFDLSDRELAEIMAFSKKVALAIEKAIPCKRIALSIVGLEVPHAHIHLIPINSISDTNFTAKKMNPTKEQLESTALSIRSFL